MSKPVDDLIMPARAAAQQDIDAFIVYRPAHLDRASERPWKPKVHRQYYRLADLMLSGASVPCRPACPPQWDKTEVTNVEFGAKFIGFLKIAA